MRHRCWVVCSTFSLTQKEKVKHGYCSYPSLDPKSWTNMKTLMQLLGQGIVSVIRFSCGKDAKSPGPLNRKFQAKHGPLSVKCIACMRSLWSGSVRVLVTNREKAPTGKISLNWSNETSCGERCSPCSHDAQIYVTNYYTVIYAQTIASLIHFVGWYWRLSQGYRNKVSVQWKIYLLSASNFFLLIRFCWNVTKRNPFINRLIDSTQD